MPKKDMPKKDTSRFTDAICFKKSKLDPDKQVVFDAGLKAGLAGEPEIASEPVHWRAGWTSGFIRRFNKQEQERNEVSTANSSSGRLTEPLYFKKATLSAADEEMYQKGYKAALDGESEDENRAHMWRCGYIGGTLERERRSKKK